MRGRRDGRLRGQADDDPRAGRQAAPLAAGARLAGGAESTPRATNGAVLDSTALDELTGGDPALIASVLRDFIATSRDDLRAVAEAAAAHDHEQLRRQAHRIAGAGRIVGAGELAALAKQLENAGAQQSGDWAGIGSLVERLAAELAKIAETVPA